MATTNNGDKDPLGVDNDSKFLLDEFMSIIDNHENTFCLYNCVLSCIHENPHICKVCKIEEGTKCENEKMLEVTFMPKGAITKGGKSCAC